MPEIGNLSTFNSFENQTGGHQTIEGVRCMITDENGHLFKYIEDTDRGENEENFYKKVFSVKDFLALKSFLPKYYGSIDIQQSEKMLKYVKIENVLYGLDCPNIMDLKVGKITYDPFASAEKIHKETYKYPGQKDIGFRLCGLKVYDSFTRIYRNVTAREFRTCSCFESPREKSLGYLKRFLGLYLFDGCDDNDILPNTCLQCRRLRHLVIEHLLEHIIEDLDNLYTVLKKQTRVVCYASSLLFAYDTKKLETLSHCALHRETQCALHRDKSKHFPSVNNYNSKHRVTDTSHKCSIYKSLEFDQRRNENELFLDNNKLFTDTEKHSGLNSCQTLHVPYNVRMIDFGHTYVDLLPRKRDENYLFGLDKLVQFFRKILEEL